jgi:hypothetical protein
VLGDPSASAQRIELRSMVSTPRCPAAQYAVSSATSSDWQPQFGSSRVSCVGALGSSVSTTVTVLSKILAHLLTAIGDALGELDCPCLGRFRHGATALGDTRY